MGLETPGLDPSKDRILEVACIITDRNLRHISPCFKASVHQTEDVLHKINGSSDLVKECLESTLSLENIESALLQFIKDRVESEVCSLAGSNICRSFLKEQMPSILPVLRSPAIDIGSLKELCWKWYPRLYLKIPRKSQVRRAAPKVKENIEELQWYRNNLFVTSGERRIITLSMPRII